METFKTYGLYARAAWFAIPVFLLCACGGRDLVAVRGSVDDAGRQPAGGNGGATDAPGAAPMLGSGASAAGASSGPPGVSSPTVTEPPSDAAAPEPVFVAPVATRVVDDMLHLAPDGPGMTGEWGTYSDRAVSWSQPPIFMSDAGVLVPADGTPVVAVTDGGGPVYEDAAQPYRRFSGAGETTWGAGLGLNFAGAPPDGGPIPLNACSEGVIFDVDAGDHDSLVQEAFDASGWSGIQFWAKSFSGLPRQVRIIIQDDRSNPFGTAPDAGGCNVCAGGCGDGPRTVVSFSSNWTHIQVPFAALQPAGWSGPGAAQRALDLSALYSVNFEVEDVPLPPFDLAVAYVELYK
jgi:hypothetical protein